MQLLSNGGGMIAVIIDILNILYTTPEEKLGTKL